jgi:hypothetical protein
VERYRALLAEAKAQAGGSGVLMGLRASGRRRASAQ